MIVAFLFFLIYVVKGHFATSSSVENSKMNFVFVYLTLTVRLPRRRFGYPLNTKDSEILVPPDQWTSGFHQQRPSVSHLDEPSLLSLGYRYAMLGFLAQDVTERTQMNAREALLVPHFKPSQHFILCTAGVLAGGEVKREVFEY